MSVKSKYLRPDCLRSSVQIKDVVITISPPLTYVPMSDMRTVDDIKAFDRMWFALNPNSGVYYRLISPPEIGEYTSMGADRLDNNFVIRVEQIKPGYRRRSCYMKILGKPKFVR